MAFTVADTVDDNLVISERLDLAERYALAPDLIVTQRDPTTVQVGTEAPRRALITGASPDTAEMLRELGQHESLAAALGRLSKGPAWAKLLRQLAASGMLVPTRRRSHGTEPNPSQRLALTHRFDVTTADRLLLTRHDAIVTVEGTGLVAETLTDLLDAAGIGRIYRPAHPMVSADADQQIPGESPSRGVGDPGIPAQRQRLHAATPVSLGTGRAISHRSPAPQVRPTVVVFAGEAPPPPGRSAELVAAVVPHLPIRVTPARIVVGPMVLPGRSACLNCLDRHRADADPRWWTPQQHSVPIAPAPLMAHLAVALAAHEIIDLVDGMRRPSSVGATIECTDGRTWPMRRPWPLHHRCLCHLPSI